ncbi:MAG: hypothetical protein WD176_08925, partial [Pirellulales bacterium]
HDLRNYLVRADGEPLAGVPPLTVVVHETLPADHDGALEELAQPDRAFAWPYRTALIVALGAWFVFTLVWLVRRMARRKPRTVAVSPGPASLADQLKPLVEAALAGTLNAEGQARLEMLLVSHWRAVLGFGDLAASEALQRIRGDARAAALVRALEAWLHERPGTHEVDLQALLAPYRGAAPIPVEDSLTAAATA